MNLTELKEGESAILAEIRLNNDIKKTLLINGICIGSIVTKNYSPRFAKLCNLSIKGKIISIRHAEASQIEIVKFTE